MFGRPSAVGLLGVMFQPKSRGSRPLVTFGFASMRLNDTRATLIMFDRSMNVSEHITSESVAVAVLPPARSSTPPSGLNCSVSANRNAAEHRVAVRSAGSRRARRTGGACPRRSATACSGCSVVFGSGMKSFEQPRRDRIDAGRRNDVAGERLAGQRIANRRAAREVAARAAPSDSTVRVSVVPRVFLKPS